MRRVWGWLALALAAHLLDVATTMVGLRAGVPEGNPVMVWALETGGEGAMYGVKVGILLAGGILIWHGTRTWTRPRWPIWAIVAVPAWLVVGNNVLVVLAAGG